MTLEEPKTVISDRRGHILVVTMNRPERLNALRSEEHFALDRIWNEFEADSSLRVAILTGAGERAFCAGNDLKFQAEGGRLDRPDTGFGGLSVRLARTKPVIAAINGIAVGGGAEIVLACDIAVATTTARLGFPEVNVGLVAAHATHRLIRSVAMKDALGLLLTGRLVGATEAMRIGLVNEVTAADNVLDAAMVWAEAIAAASPNSVRVTLDIIRASAAAGSIDKAIASQGRALQALPQHPDFHEGPMAFREGRPPVWKD
ncbi:MAG: enoyl-CoA hydratase-related protein [Hyphomicrobiaceae bacterium]